VERTASVASGGEGNQVKEEWRDIVGYEGLYQVSSYGRVRSFSRKTKTKPVRVMRLGITGKYLLVILQNNKIRRTFYVHRLVAKAFIPRVSGKPEVAHRDGVGTNNHVSNLRWTTHLENEHDKIRHKTRLYGEHSNAPVIKLTPTDVVAIRRSNLTARELAAKYGVNVSNINNIWAYRTWKHVI
jgi:hypothetical protein